MADYNKKKKQETCDYKAAIMSAKAAGPDRLYLMYGPEDYLRDYALESIKNICLPSGDDGFSLKRFNGPSLDISAFSSALDLMPFLNDRTFIELHDIDINKQPDPDILIEILIKIPDWCTVVFVQNPEYELDGRLKLVKAIKKEGRDMYFGNQNQSDLFKWIKKRFAALGKNIDNEALQRLVFVSGDLMNKLIPEIEKAAAFSSGNTVTVADINAVAARIPEADTFEMANCISNKKFDDALEILTDLLSSKDSAPIAFLASLSYQFRRLYGIKLAMKKNMSVREIMDVFGIKYDFIVRNTVASVKIFSIKQLRNAVLKCAQYEYAMKTSQADQSDLLKETVVSIIADCAE